MRGLNLDYSVVSLTVPEAHLCAQTYHHGLMMSLWSVVLRWFIRDCHSSRIISDKNKKDSDVVLLVLVVVECPDGQWECGKKAKDRSLDSSKSSLMAVLLRSIF
ncbi:unnamed protein product [Nezara viridula]|uniref:Uncharacterized protein n=1 Tax=Nezara viridula TaxID=85310 RepID=A0A9P0EG78_NEZVI|nr:unnamed protein product [Nezara viridula]